jgi:hypothetical protein
VILPLLAVSVVGLVVVPLTATVIPLQGSGGVGVPPFPQEPLIKIVAIKKRRTEEVKLKFFISIF